MCLQSCSKDLDAVVNAPLKQLAGSGHSGVLCSGCTAGDNAGNQPAISHNLAGREHCLGPGIKSVSIYSMSIKE